MPLLANHVVRLKTGTLAEVHQVLSQLLKTERPGALVLTEVGLNGGRDVFLAGLALNIRVEQGRIVISADEKSVTS